MLFLELARRQEDLRRIDELRSHDFERRRNFMSMHHQDAYNVPPVGNTYQNQGAPNANPYNNNFQQAPYGNPSPFAQPTPPIDAAYTTNQVARGYNLPQGPPNVRPTGVDYSHHQQQGFDRKRPRY